MKYSNTNDTNQQQSLCLLLCLFRVYVIVTTFFYIHQSVVEQVDANIFEYMFSVLFHSQDMMERSDVGCKVASGWAASQGYAVG